MFQDSPSNLAGRLAFESTNILKYLHKVPMLDESRTNSYYNNNTSETNSSDNFIALSH